MKKIILALFLFLVSCGVPVSEPIDSFKNLENNNNSMELVYSTDYKKVYRFYDVEKDVTCWVYDSSFGGGISCLPNDEIRK